MGDYASFADQSGHEIFDDYFEKDLNIYFPLFASLFYFARPIGRCLSPSN